MTVAIKFCAIYKKKHILAKIHKETMEIYMNRYII